MSKLEDLRAYAAKATRRLSEASSEIQAAQSEEARALQAVADEEKGWHIVPGTWNMIRKGPHAIKLEFVTLSSGVVPPFIEEQKAAIQEIVATLKAGGQP